MLIVLFNFFISLFRFGNNQTEENKIGFDPKKIRELEFSKGKE